MGVLSGKIWKLILSISIIVLFSTCLLLLNANAGSAVQTQIPEGFDAGRLTPQEIEYLTKAIRENRIDPGLIRRAKEEGKGKTDDLKERTEAEKDKKEKLTYVVYLYGDVLKPGSYKFTEGMAIKDLLPGLSSLKQDAYLGHAIIKRIRTEAKEPDVRFNGKFPYSQKEKS